MEWDWKWKPTGNETATESAKLSEMLLAAESFVSDVITGAEPRWLTLIGRAGCGKTHLADRIRWFLLEWGESLYNRHVRSVRDPLSSRVETIFSYAQEGRMFAKWGKLLEKARDGDYSPLRMAGRDHYKVIDDLGVDSFDRDAKATVFATQKMAELLDQRLGKWTVITTNFNRKQLAEQFDPRIASRLLRGGSVIVDCEDLRDFNLRREAKKAA